MIILPLALALLACTPDVSVPKDTPDTGPPSDTDTDTDTDADTDTDTVDAPTAVAAADPSAGTVPLGVTLSSAGSSATIGTLESFEWTLPDGSVLAGETVTATLLEAGTQRCTLRVTDEGGRSDQASVDVETACPEFADAIEAGTMSWGEVSGLASASTEGILWAHSDAQGGGAEIHAITTDARFLGTFVLAGVSDYDWEDIARGPGPEPGVSYLYIGDTGDNSEYRSSVTVYRVREPLEFTGGLIAEVDRLVLTYPDGPRDCETLIIDPLTGDLILVERDRDDEGVSGIYVAGAPLSTTGSTELTHTGTLTFGVDPLPGDVDTTGGDVSPDGSLVLVRTHDRVWVFPRDPAEPLWTAFDAPACGTPEVDESKGEAVTFAWDGSGYYTGGEGSNQPLHWHDAL